MEKKENKLQERIDYIKCIYDDGRVSYTGQSKNYGVVCSSWKSVDDLKNKMKAMIQMWINLAQDTIEQPDGLEMRECTEPEWDAKDDNIDYWEIERIKRILSRKSVQKILLPELVEVLGNNELAAFALSTIIDTKAHEKQ